MTRLSSPTAEQLVLLLMEYKIQASDERSFQDAVEKILNERVSEHRREIALAPGERPDFMVNGTALELKVDGAAGTVQRQLWRYLKHESVNAVILVTTRSKHLPVRGMVLNKPIHVIVVRQW